MKTRGDSTVLVTDWNRINWGHKGSLAPRTVYDVPEIGIMKGRYTVLPDFKSVIV